MAAGLSCTKPRRADLQITGPGQDLGPAHVPAPGPVVRLRIPVPALAQGPALAPGRRPRHRFAGRADLTALATARAPGAGATLLSSVALFPTLRLPTSGSRAPITEGLFLHMVSPPPPPYSFKNAEQSLPAHYLFSFCPQISSHS